MARYLDLGEGDRVLDTTCGLGSDAIVASHVVGRTGHVLALEKSEVLSAMVREGLRIYEHRTPEVTDAMRRVEVVAGDARSFLSAQPDRSWDVVYFDPMFSGTVQASLGLEVVRRLAYHDEIDEETILDACRVARRCVAMKDRAPGRQLQALGFGDVSSRGRIYYGKRMI